MKKLLLLLAVAFSASLFACGGDKNAEANDSTACKDSCPATEAPAPEAPAAEAEATDSAAPAAEAEAAPAEAAPAEAAK